MKTGLVLAALALSLAGSLAAQVPLRPQADTTPRPTWPGASAPAAKTRHSHPWLGAAVGAVAGGVIGYVAWRPCREMVCVPRTQSEAAAVGALAGALVGATVGSFSSTASRAPVPWQRPYTLSLGVAPIRAPSPRRTRVTCAELH